MGPIASDFHEHVAHAGILFLRCKWLATGGLEFRDLEHMRTPGVIKVQMVLRTNERKKMIYWRLANEGYR